LTPHPGLNLVFGQNGAGKTSVIESIVVLSRGRSFRSTQASDLVGSDHDYFRVFAQTGSQGDREHRLGLERSGKHWRARKDGADLQQLSQLTRSLPLMLMEPNSHLLVSGTPDHRRKFLDWGMFHVEQPFLDTWRNYSKILKQRNAALRSGQVDVLDSLDEVAAAQGESLSSMRESHFSAVKQKLKSILGELNKDLSDISLDYERGWRGSSLGKALASSRENDLRRGMTGSGPHRADLSLSWRKTDARNILSRGEQKLVAAALLLCQGKILSEGGEGPVVLLDDIASEFDREHFEAVLECALECGGQVWVTGTSRQTTEHPHKMFHVERGGVREMV
jgi:DNA replication and repair protein RecF